MTPPQLVHDKKHNLTKTERQQVFGPKKTPTLTWKNLVLGK